MSEDQITAVSQNEPVIEIPIDVEKEVINVPPKESPVEILTRQELHDTAVERVHLISKEFTDAFNFLRKYPKSVTFLEVATLKNQIRNTIKHENLVQKLLTN